jgi:hypothetical protein
VKLIKKPTTRHRGDGQVDVHFTTIHSSFNKNYRKNSIGVDKIAKSEYNGAAANNKIPRRL